MKAAILEKPGRVVVREVPGPKTPEGWVLVRSRAVGICGTDKAFYRGTYPLLRRPLIPGHEVSGEVVEGPEHLVGRRVVSEINFACLRCELCKAGLYTHCPYKKTLGIDFDGGMAEYFAAPAWALHPHNLPHEVAFAAEPLAAVLNALSQYPPRPGWKVAILGTGFIALLAAQTLASMGYDPVVVAREGSVKAERIARLGFTVATHDEALDQARGSWSRLGYDMVIEATGTNEGLRQAIALARPRGVVHLKSTPGGSACFNQTLAVVKELRLIGTRCGTHVEFRRALELLADGIVKPVVDAKLSLDRAPEAFNEALKPDKFRVIVEP